MILKGLSGPCQSIGPVNAPVYKVNDMYRKILYIKCENCDILDKIRNSMDVLTESGAGTVQVQYDVS